MEGIYSSRTVKVVGRGHGNHNEGDRNYVSWGLDRRQRSLELKAGIWKLLSTTVAAGKKMISKKLEDQDGRREVVLTGGGLQKKGSSRLVKGRAGPDQRSESRGR